MSDPFSLPGYDEWKTHNPDDDRCEHCGADPRFEGRDGWQPDKCNGECGRRWRDPDAEYDAMRDEEIDGKRFAPVDDDPF